MPEPGDQTEAELERTRKVVAAQMAEQVVSNSDAAEVVDEEADEPAPAKPAASQKKGTR